MPLAGRDVVLHGHGTRAFAQQLHTVLRIEVALLLQEVADIEGAFVQQVVIDRTLFIDGHDELLA